MWVTIFVQIIVLFIHFVCMPIYGGTEDIIDNDQHSELIRIINPALKNFFGEKTIRKVERSPAIRIKTSTYISADVAASIICFYSIIVNFTVYISLFDLSSWRKRRREEDHDCYAQHCQYSLIVSHTLSILYEYKSSYLINKCISHYVRIDIYHSKHDLFTFLERCGDLGLAMVM